MSANSPQMARPTAAFVLSLLAGLWMLGSGTIRYRWQGMMGGWHGAGGMMWSHGMMWRIAPTFWWAWFGIVAGVLVLTGAVILYTRPNQRRTWGLVVLIVSALNIVVGMGGFFAGVLGVIGGALALSWQSGSVAGPRDHSQGA
ncbi:MAG: DUF6114 domain-containing protein [Candidatus Binatia bacterium]